MQPSETPPWLVVIGVSYNHRRHHLPLTWWFYARAPPRGFTGLAEFRRGGRYGWNGSRFLRIGAGLPEGGVFPYLRERSVAFARAYVAKTGWSAVPERGPMFRPVSCTTQ